MVEKCVCPVYPVYPDTVSAETVVYTYDALKRLTQAAATPNSGSTPAAWTQSFQYDGFGNLTARVLNGTTTMIGVTAATNRLSSSSYDANGNMTSGAGASFTYDEMNRLSKAAPTSGGEEHYAYSPDNRRIHTINPYGAERFTLYGAHGEKIGIYYLNFQGHIEQTEADIWFGGRLIWQGPPAIGGAVLEDRVGTGDTTLARPYGENSGHFATYSQDSFTTLHYADQRYYASAYGRFNTADQYMASAGPDDPGSWNRYAYVEGDPINEYDPTGEFQLKPPPVEPIGAPSRPPGLPTRPTVPSDPITEFPECNPNGNKTIEKKLDFVNSNFSGAMTAATFFEEGTTNSKVNSTALATMFLQWSIGESGYPGDNAQVTAENNWFGFQRGGTGAWDGLEINCPQSAAIPANSQNACFSMSTSWGQELNAALSSVSGKTGITYGQALQNALGSGVATTAGLLQAIAQNGWNKSSTYGADKTSGMSIQAQITCLQQNGYIK